MICDQARVRFARLSKGAREQPVGIGQIAIVGQADGPFGNTCCLAAIKGWVAHGRIGNGDVIRQGLGLCSSQLQPVVTAYEHEGVTDHQALQACELRRRHFGPIEYGILQRDISQPVAMKAAELRPREIGAARRHRLVAAIKRATIRQGNAAHRCSLRTSLLPASRR